MQARNMRPAFSRLSGRVLNRRLQTGSITRGFHQSSYKLQDDKSDAPGPQRQPEVPRRVQRSTQAANDVQQIYKLSQSRRQPGQPPVRRPPPDESGLPSGSEFRQRRPQPAAVDLRSLGTEAKDGETPRPVLRPRSSYPANRGQQTSRGPYGAGLRQPGGGRGRSGRGGESDRAATRAPRQQLAEENWEEDPEAKALERAAESESARTYQKLEQAELEQSEKPILWSPGEETLESLDAYMPRLPLSEAGTTRQLTSRLTNTTDPISIHTATRVRDLAARLRSGGYVLFRDEDEKAAVLEEAQKMAQKSAERKSERIGEVVTPIVPEFEPLGKSSRAALEQEVYEGKYPDPVESIQHGELDRIIHLIRKNPSYKPHDEAAILKKLGEMIQPPPATPIKPATKTPRKKAKQAE